MAINAKAKIPQTSETIVGTALFNFILFSTRCASRDLLSPEGIIELRRRVRVTSLALQKAFPKSDGTAHESSTPIVDAAELTRQLRLGMEKPWDYPDLVALRIIMSAALADCGATRRWRFLGGSSLTPQDLKALDEQRDDQAAWRGTFIRLVARASQRQKQHLINIRRLHDEYLEKLKAYKIDQPSRQATVDILFARPILSRADLVKELHRREIKCADRTAQAILAEFAEARIVRSFGAKTLWQAENLLLSGVSGQT